MSCDCFEFKHETDEFRMWQGLVGAHYTPSVDQIGNLSWTNNGGLPNPPTVNIAGKGLNIVGIVATAAELPATTAVYNTYLVGTEDPYDAYIFDGTTWVNLGLVGKGDTGDPGEDGFSPEIDITSITGGHRVEVIDKEGTEYFDVMDGTDGAPGVGVPSGGSTGAYLAKSSPTDFDAIWKNPSSVTPLMDGTAAAGISTDLSRSDHVHPTDTSRQEAITASGILKGSGSAVSAAVKGTDYGVLSFTITLTAASWSNKAQTISNANFLASGFAYIVAPASASFAAYGESQIYADDVSANGSMTFHCTNVPSADLTVNVVRAVSA